MNYYVVDNTTGEILKTGTCSPDDLSLQAAAGQTAKIGNVEDNLFYELSGVITARPDFSISLDLTEVGIDEDATFTSIPVGTVVKWDDEAETITDGTLVFSASDAGTYNLNFTLFPYKPKMFTIEVS